MTTATTNETTYLCQVRTRRTEGTMTVTSPSGKSVTLRLSDAERGDLWSRLTEFPSQTVALTVAEMKTVLKWSEAETARVAAAEAKVAEERAEAERQSREKAEREATELVNRIADERKTTDDAVNRIRSRQSADLLAMETRDIRDYHIAGVGYGSWDARQLDMQQRYLAAAARVSDRVRNETYYTLEYDIPDSVSSLSEEEGGCPNPAAELRPYSVRSSKSVVTVPGRMLQELGFREILNRLCRHPSVVVRLRKVHPDETAATIYDVQEATRNRLQQMHTSFIRSLATADEKLAKLLANEPKEGETGPVAPLTPKKIEAAQNDRNNRVRGLIRALRADLATALESAELYDQHENAKDLFDGLRALLNDRTAEFNAAMEATGGKRV